MVEKMGETLLEIKDIIFLAVKTALEIRKNKNALVPA